MIGELCIAVLEDNLDRREAMLARLHDRFPQFPVRFFHEPAEMIVHLRQHLSQVMLISLDHDLDLIPQSDGTLLDPGTGMDLVNFLSTQAPTCPVVIHSSNLDAARKMQRLLNAGGWQTRRVTPRDDLAWIDAEWFAAARHLLVTPAIPIQAEVARTSPEELTSIP